MANIGGGNIDSVIGFSPNWLFGQQDAGLSIYVSPGEINGQQFSGGVVPVLSNTITPVWVNVDGSIQSDVNFPTTAGFPPVTGNFPTIINFLHNQQTPVNFPQTNVDFPTNPNIFPVAFVLSGAVITGGNTNGPNVQTNPGVLQIIDIRPTSNFGSFFAFASSSIMGNVLGNSVIIASGSLLVPIGAEIVGQGFLSLLPVQTSAALIATLTGVGSVSSTLSGSTGVLVISITGTGTVQATLFNQNQMAGFINGAGSVSATLGGTGVLSDTILGVGSVVANEANSSIAQITGKATVSAALNSPIVATLAGVASLVAVITGTQPAAVLASAILGKGSISALGQLQLPLTITNPSSLPGDTVNVAYSDQLVGSGGVSPYTWAVTSGSLPPGITLNTSTGVLSGTPTNTGNFSFTIQITDSA